MPRIISLRRSWVTLAVCALLLPIAGVVTGKAGMAQQGDCALFSETGKGLCGKFLEYWNTHGGLAQHGFPLTDEISEQSDIDHKSYSVQYLERSIFEFHPENQPPYDVLLSLLGRMEYKKQWPGPYYPIQSTSTANPLSFVETGKTLGGKFRTYWEEHGGLAQFGYPVTNEFEERSLLDSEMYTVQYFERAVFELHPENQPPNDVLLSQLGRFRYDMRYGNAGNRPSPTPITGRQDCFDALRAKGTVLARGTNNIPNPYQGLKTYQVEEVRVWGSFSCGLIPNSSKFDRYWRVTVFADGPFCDGCNQIPFLWLDDALLGPAAVSQSTGGYVTNVFDLASLREGGVISIGPSPVNRGSTGLPEKLQFNHIP